MARGRTTHTYGALRHHFFRAPIDNDGIRGSSYAKGWVDHKLDQLKTQIRGIRATDSSHGRGVTITARHDPEGARLGFQTVTAYLLDDGGRLTIETEVHCDASLPNPLPRIGITLDIDGAFGHVQWLGRGPHENYIDRVGSAFFGRYEAAVDELAVPYIHPTENGGRTGVREFYMLHSGNTAFVTGKSIHITSDTPFQFSAHRYTTADLFAAAHTVDLPRRPNITLCLDHRHLGVGGDTGWTPSVYPGYHVKPGVFRYRFHFSVVNHDSLDGV